MVAIVRKGLLAYFKKKKGADADLPLIGRQNRADEMNVFGAIFPSVLTVEKSEAKGEESSLNRSMELFGQVRE